MKLNKVFSIMKKEKEILLQDGINNSQWIGTQKAIFLLSNLPPFSADNIFQLMGIKEEQQENYELFENGFDVTLEDITENEKDVLSYRIRLRSGDSEIIPLNTTEGLVFIDEKYLQPIYDMPQIRLYERKDENGMLYIVVKSGMWCFAVIEPMRVLNRTAVEELEKLTKCARAKLNYYEGKGLFTNEIQGY